VGTRYLDPMALGPVQESGHAVIVPDAYGTCSRTGPKIFFNRCFDAVLSNLPSI
jgi:hypothetical protein